MDLKKSSQRFLKSVWSMRLLFLIVASLGISFLCVFGTSNAQYQYKTQKSISKGGEAYIKVTSPAENEVWEKGKKYTIRWESKGIRSNLKILLVSEDLKLSQDAKVVKPRQVTKDKEVKPFEITKNTYNSGSYSYIVSRNLPNGIYKIQIMTIDESVKGESEGTITIGGQKLAGVKAISQQEQGKVTAATKYGTQPGTAQTGGTAGTRSSQVAAVPPAATAPSSGVAPSTSVTPSAGTTASTGVTPSTASTPSKAGTPSVGIAGKTPAAAEKVVKQQFTVVKVSEADLKNLPVQKSAASSSDLEIGGKSTSGVIKTPKIVVTAPKDGDVWEAGKEYNIIWESTGFTGNADVKIALAATQYDLKPITERTANTGAYRFRVPRNFAGDFRGWRVRVCTLDENIRGWSPPFTLYSQDVDLECKIYDPKIGWPGGYLKENKEYTWLQFNVWIRNDGIRFPISVDKVLVQMIKEPEEIVCYKEEWGFGGIYPHEWYKLPDPRKIELSSCSDDSRRNKGVFRVEVWLDPENRLGENEIRRYNNKAVEKWIIK